MAKQTPRERTINKIQRMIESHLSPSISLFDTQASAYANNAAAEIYDYMNLRSQRAKRKR